MKIVKKHFPTIRKHETGIIKSLNEEKIDEKKNEGDTSPDKLDIGGDNNYEIPEKPSIFTPTETGVKKAKGILAGTAAEALGLLVGLQIAIHETGHYAAFKMLYENPKIFMGVDGLGTNLNCIKDFILSLGSNVTEGFGGIVCEQFEEGGLNTIGKLLGETKALATTYATGYLAEESFAIASFITGYKLRKSNPTAGYALMGMGGLHHLLIAGNLLTDYMHNDFKPFFDLTGISPAVSTLAIVASLPVLATILHLHGKHSEGNEIKQEATGVEKN
jgi:hypothetical protein